MIIKSLEKFVLYEIFVPLQSQISRGGAVVASLGS